MEGLSREAGEHLNRLRRKEKVKNNSSSQVALMVTAMLSKTDRGTNTLNQAFPYYPLDIISFLRYHMFMIQQATASNIFFFSQSVVGG